MSFILDALKKSETDRQRQSSPALFEVKVAAPRRRFPWWAGGLAVLLGVNMLVLVWLLLRRPEPVAQAAPAAAAPATAPLAANAAGPGMVTVPATVTLPTTVNIPLSAAPSVSMGAGPAQPGAEGRSRTPPLADEPLLQDEEPAVPPDYDPRDYQPAITPEQAGAIAAARRNGALPSRDEVMAQGNPLPDLRLDMHVYADSPADRFVFINMHKLREGDSTPEGVRVDEITRNGVELSYRGKQFALAQ
ncbi:MAG TPA: general secretion pathway protein GspB [Steroidobacteraceae bacterium]|nr:general secretion pathway protein GspB [Steroidobacteraceae bacterium]